MAIRRSANWNLGRSRRTGEVPRLRRSAALLRHPTGTGTPLSMHKPASTVPERRGRRPSEPRRSPLDGWVSLEDDASVVGSLWAVATKARGDALMYRPAAYLTANIDPHQRDRAATCDP